MTSAIVEQHSARNYVFHPVIAIIADRLVTVAFWEFEANPLVSHLGITRWFLLTAFLLVAMVATWYHWELYRSRIAIGCVLGLAALQGIIVVLNVSLVAGLF